MKKTAKIVVALLLAMVMVLTMFAAVACDNPEEDPCKDGHNLKVVQRKEATTEAAGYEAYWECQDCHKKFSDAEGKNEIQKPVEIQKLPALVASVDLTGHAGTLTGSGADATMTFTENGITVTCVQKSAKDLEIQSKYEQRFYQGSNLTISYTSNFKYIVLHCYKDYKTLNEQTFDGLTIEENATDNTIKITLDNPASSITLESLKKQIRVGLVEIFA